MPYDGRDDVTYDKLRETEMQAAAATERQEQVNHNSLIEEVCEKIRQAEDEITAGNTADARQPLNDLRKKYGL